MGLGLPMVKQIVEDADGKIWFETPLILVPNFKLNYL